MDTSTTHIETTTPGRNGGAAILPDDGHHSSGPGPEVMDAATLQGNFAKIEAFWTTKKVDDAIGFAKAGGKGAADLEAAAKAKSDDRIAAASMAATGACGGCHMAHRERLPDMTFEIK